MFDSSGIETISGAVPTGISAITSTMFTACHNLTDVVIPSNVRSIGTGAFYNCSGMTSLYMGNMVLFIEDYAFKDCSSLTSITIDQAFVPTMRLNGGNESHIFDNTNNCPIFVQPMMVNTFKGTGYWVKYADRIQAIPNN